MKDVFESREEKPWRPKTTWWRTGESELRGATNYVGRSKEGGKRSRQMEGDHVVAAYVSPGTRGTIEYN